MSTNKLLAGAALALMAQAASASTFTSTAPNGLDVTTVGASTVGGAVIHLIGINGTQVVSQIAASTMYVGFSGPANPLVFGNQSGFTSAVTGVLGGGLSRMSLRISLYDGDTASSNFDENDNTMLFNGISLGDWSAVNAQETNSSGVALSGGFSGGGFRNNTLDTGWFDVTNAGTLASIFTSLTSTQAVVLSLFDVDPDDNFYDFTQGIDASLINVGTGPVVTPPNPTTPIPEPATFGLAALALLGVALARRKA